MNIGPGALLGGRYELVALVGRGGMADVFRAEDRLLHRPVAVKVLRDSPDTDADRARFAAEARVLAGLAHPGLVLLLDAGSEDDHPYLVLELVEGQTWGGVLAGHAADPSEVARIGVQVAAALASAHAAGVVHRDVKPGNVLVTGGGRAKLADFGIARLVDENVRHTRTGFTVGTAAYLAPEQVRGEDVTTAVDVYALGLVLLEAVTGERAYPGTSTEAAFARLQRSPVIPLSLPRGWPRLLAAMTATDPAERPTAAEVADRLATLADPSSAELVVPDDVTEAVALATPAGRRALPWPLLVSAAALVLVLVAAGLVRGLGGEPTVAAEESPTARPSSSASAVARPAAATTTAPAAVRTTPEPQPKATPKRQARPAAQVQHPPKAKKPPHAAKPAKGKEHARGKKPAPKAKKPKKGKRH